MSATNHFIAGQNDIYISFRGQAMRADYTNFSVSQKIDTVDVSAGVDDDKTYKPALKDVSFSLELYNTGTAGSAIQSALQPDGTEGTLIYGPQGTAAGKPKYECLAYSTGYDDSYPFADGAKISVTLQRSGAWTAHYEQLGSTF